jgi:hypothetical protein
VSGCCELRSSPRRRQSGFFIASANFEIPLYSPEWSRREVAGAEHVSSKEDSSIEDGSVLIKPRAAWARLVLSETILKPEDPVSQRQKENSIGHKIKGQPIQESCVLSGVVGDGSNLRVGGVAACVPRKTELRIEAAKLAPSR